MARRGSPVRWWLEPEDSDDVAHSVADAARAVDQLTTARQQGIIDAYCLYGDVPAWAVSRRLDDSAAIAHNVIAQAIDALVAEMTQSLPRPMVVPVGGDWMDTRRGKKLTRFLDAKLKLLELDDVALQWVRDAAIAGLGALHIFEEDGESHIERLWPGHLLVDDTACVDVDPPAFYVKRPMDIERAKAINPDRADAVENSTRARAEHSWTWALDPRADVIELIEAWHPPSAPGRADGRHVICTWDGICLRDDVDWDGTDNRVIWLRAVKPVVGFWGESLVLRARTAQLELNKLLRRVQDSMHLFAVPRVYVQRQSAIVEGHMTNDIGIVVEHDGPPPQFSTPPAMSPDVYAHIERLCRWIFDEVGVTGIAAKGEPSPGVTSGIAMRTLLNTQSRRFVNLGRAVERGYCQTAKCVLAIESLLAQNDRSREVVYRKRGRTIRIQWSDMALEDQAYVLDVFPASALPKDLASKLQALQEMLASGSIDQDMFWSLADMPDFEGVRDRLMAPTEALLERFDIMIETGQYMPADTYQDLKRGLKYCAATLQLAELEGVPDERLELLRQWHSQASRLMGLITPEELQPPQLGAAPTQGAPPPIPQQNAPAPSGMQ